MQNDYSNKQKNNISGGVLAVIISIVLIVGFVSGAGVYHVARNGFTLDGLVQTTESPNTNRTPTIGASATMSPHVNPNITQLPQVDPPTINANDPVVDLYAKLNDTVVSVYIYVDGQLQGNGSGVIFTQEGHVLTNHHVIDGVDRVTVTINDGEELETVLVGSDSRSDIAVLKITTPGEYHAASLGDSDALKVGQSVVAIGSNIGLSGSLTQGIISYLNRAVDGDGIRRRMIQTDCALNVGNSGGPLFNLYGEVIGITSMKEVYTYTSQGNVPVFGVSYAIPINYVKDVALALMTEGRVTRAAIGIVAQSHIASNQYAGVKVVELASEGSAEKAGIQVGDIIIGLDGVNIYMMEDLSEQLSLKTVGQVVNVKVLRNDVELSFDVTLTVLSE